MSTRQKVLNYLMAHSPQAISGQTMANELGVSRNAVWKVIEELRQQGYSIEQQGRKGYALTRITRRLDALQIGVQLPYLTVEVQPVVTSTNDLAKIHAVQKSNQPYLLVAREQTKGRGRHGRSFHSQLKEGLYLSLALRPATQKADEIALYTLLAATSLSQTMEKYVGQSVAIKWINDLFFKNRKVCGILCESVMDVESFQVSHLIIGIGINLAGTFETDDERTHRVAGTLFGESLPQNFNWNTFLVDFVQKIWDYHQHFEEKTFLSHYRQRLLGLNKEVTYRFQDQIHHGIIRGINDQGHLLVEKEEGEIDALFSQEIHFSSDQFI